MLAGLTISREQALLGLPGCPLLLLATRVANGLELVPLHAPGPLYALRRRGPELLIHCGDAGSASLLRLEAAGLRLLDHHALPVDCVGVTAWPQTSRFTALVQTAGGDHV